MSARSPFRVVQLGFIAPFVIFAMVVLVGLFAWPDSDADFDGIGIYPTGTEMMEEAAHARFLHQEVGDRLRYSVDTQSSEGRLVYQGGIDCIGEGRTHWGRGKYWGQFLEQVEAREQSAGAFVHEFVRPEPFILQCAEHLRAIEAASAQPSRTGATQDRVRLDWNDDGKWDAEWHLAAGSEQVEQFLEHLQSEEVWPEQERGYPHAEWHEVAPGPLFNDLPSGAHVKATVSFQSCYGGVLHELSLLRLSDGEWRVQSRQSPDTENEKAHHYVAKAARVAEWDAELERLRPWHDPDGGFLNTGIFIYLDWDADGSVDEELWFFDPGFQGYKEVKLGNLLIGK